MSDYVDLDDAPMEWLCEPFDLIFKWSGGPYIEVGRYERFSGRRIFDQCVNVYDYAAGKVTLERTYAAFKARCDEWAADMYAEETDCEF